MAGDGGAALGKIRNGSCFWNTSVDLSFLPFLALSRKNGKQEAGGQNENQGWQRKMLEHSRCPHWKLWPWTYTSLGWPRMDPLYTCLSLANTQWPTWAASTSPAPWGEGTWADQEAPGGAPGTCLLACAHEAGGLHTSWYQHDPWKEVWGRTAHLSQLLPYISSYNY